MKKDIRDGWVDMGGWFPRVVTFADAATLLNEPDLHADFDGLFTAAGAGSGRARIALETSLLSMNGDEHKRVRAAIAGMFTPRAAARLRPFAAEVARELIGTMPDGSFDLMADFATPYVERTTADYIGFPLDDIARTHDAVMLVSEAVMDLGQRAAEWDAGLVALLDYAEEKLSAEPPPGTILESLVEMVDEGVLNTRFAATLISTLLSAGQEPTIFQLGILVQTFAEHPGAWTAMQEESVSVERTIEEALRYRSTNPGIDRLVHRDVTHRGITFAAGGRVLVEISDANHDPARFGCPADFDVDANAAGHLAFGFGPHHCLGAALARAQLQEAVRALVEEFDAPVVHGSDEKTAGGLRGPTRLEVTLRRRP